MSRRFLCCRSTRKAVRYWPAIDPLPPYIPEPPDGRCYCARFRGSRVNTSYNGNPKEKKQHQELWRNLFDIVRHVVSCVSIYNCVIYCVQGLNCSWIEVNYCQCYLYLLNWLYTKSYYNMENACLWAKRNGIHIHIYTHTHTHTHTINYIYIYVYVYPPWMYAWYAVIQFAVEWPLQYIDL